MKVGATHFIPNNKKWRGKYMKQKKSLKKRWISIAVMVALVLSLVSTVALAESDHQWEYSVNADDTATITGFYDEYLGVVPINDVIIPSTVGGHTVTAIGTDAFKNGLLRGTLTIPNTVKTIGNGAFENNNALTSIIFEATSVVESIGDNAFKDNGLTSVTIPTSVKNIDDSAFLNQRVGDGVKTLTTLTFDAPSSIQTIAGEAFAGNAIASVSLPNSLVSFGNIFYENDSSPALTFVLPTPSMPGYVLTGWLGDDNFTYPVGTTITDLNRSFELVSTDATLSGITLSAGTLSPSFASGTDTYTASVANGVDTMTVTPTTTNGNATVTVNGTTAATPVNLSVGDTAIPVVVTAQDGTTQQTYTITVTRAAAPTATPTATPTAAPTSDDSDSEEQSASEQGPIAQNVRVANVPTGVYLDEGNTRTIIGAQRTTLMNQIDAGQAPGTLIALEGIVLRNPDGSIYKGKATVTLDLPDIKVGDNVTIVHYKEDGTVEYLKPIKIENGRVTFESTFSPIAVVVQVGSTMTSVSTSPKTGEQQPIMHWIAIAVFALGFGGILLKKTLVKR
jgi:hypothetical protein